MTSENIQMQEDLIYELKYLGDLIEDNEDRCIFRVTIKNIDKEEMEENFHPKTGTEEEFNKWYKKLQSMPSIKLEDIVKCENPKIHMFEDRNSEVISFKTMFEFDTFYIKLNVWDNLSPNRWYNGLNEWHLDETQYSIYVNLEFSQNKKYLKNWKKNINQFLLSY